MTLDDKTIDKRVVRRHLERGRVDAAEYRRKLESLPDLSAHVQRPEATAGESARPVQPRHEAAAADLSPAASLV